MLQGLKDVFALFDALKASGYEIKQGKEKEKSLPEISSLRSHITQYIKARDVYVGYIRK